MQNYTRDALIHTITQSGVPTKPTKNTLFAGIANQIRKVKPIIVVLCNYAKHSVVLSSLTVFSYRFLTG